MFVKSMLDWYRLYFMLIKNELVSSNGGMEIGTFPVVREKSFAAPNDSH